MSVKPQIELGISKSAMVLLHMTTFISNSFLIIDRVSLVSGLISIASIPTRKRPSPVGFTVTIPEFRSTSNSDVKLN